MSNDFNTINKLENRGKGFRSDSGISRSSSYYQLDINYNCDTDYLNIQLLPVDLTKTEFQASTSIFDIEINSNQTLPFSLMENISPSSINSSYEKTTVSKSVVINSIKTAKTQEISNKPKSDSNVQVVQYFTVSQEHAAPHLQAIAPKEDNYCELNINQNQAKGDAKEPKKIKKRHKDSKKMEVKSEKPNKHKIQVEETKIKSKPHRIKDKTSEKKKLPIENIYKDENEEIYYILMTEGGEVKKKEIKRITESETRQPKKHSSKDTRVTAKSSKESKKIEATNKKSHHKKKPAEKQEEPSKLVVQKKPIKNEPSKASNSTKLSFRRTFNNIIDDILHSKTRKRKKPSRIHNVSLKSGLEEAELKYKLVEEKNVELKDKKEKVKEKKEGKQNREDGKEKKEKQKREDSKQKTESKQKRGDSKEKKKKKEHETESTRIKKREAKKSKDKDSEGNVDLRISTKPSGEVSVRSSKKSIGKSKTPKVSVEDLLQKEEVVPKKKKSSHREEPAEIKPLDYRTSKAYTVVEQIKDTDSEKNIPHKFKSYTHQTEFGIRKKRLKKKSPRRRNFEDMRAFRREVSFSQLNLAPVTAFYKTPSQVFNFSSSDKNMPKKKMDKITDSARAYSSSIMKMFKDQKYDKNKRPNIHCKNVDNKTILSELVTRKEFDKFREKRPRSTVTNHSNRKSVFKESLVETSRKTTSDVGEKTLGFTVEGIEPPRKLERVQETWEEKQERADRRKRLHMTIFSVVEIKSLPPFDSTIGPFSDSDQKSLIVEEDMQSDSSVIQTKSANTTMDESYNPNDIFIINTIIEDKKNVASQNENAKSQRSDIFIINTVIEDHERKGKTKKKALTESSASRYSSHSGLTSADDEKTRFQTGKSFDDFSKSSESARKLRSLNSVTIASGATDSEIKILNKDSTPIKQLKSDLHSKLILLKESDTIPEMEMVQVKKSPTTSEDSDLSENRKADFKALKEKLKKGSLFSKSSIPRRTSKKEKIETKSLPVSTNEKVDRPPRSKSAAPKHSPFDYIMPPGRKQQNSFIVQPLIIETKKEEEKLVGNLEEQKINEFDVFKNLTTEVMTVHTLENITEESQSQYSTDGSTKKTDRSYCDVKPRAYRTPKSDLSSGEKTEPSQEEAKKINVQPKSVKKTDAKSYCEVKPREYRSKIPPKKETNQARIMKESETKSEIKPAFKTNPKISKAFCDVKPREYRQRDSKSEPPNEEKKKVEVRKPLPKTCTYFEAHTRNNTFKPKSFCDVRPRECKQSTCPSSSTSPAVSPRNQKIPVRKKEDIALTCQQLISILKDIKESGMNLKNEPAYPLENLIQALQTAKYEDLILLEERLNTILGISPAASEKSEPKNEIQLEEGQKEETKEPPFEVTTAKKEEIELEKAKKKEVKKSSFELAKVEKEENKKSPFQFTFPPNSKTQVLYFTGDRDFEESKPDMLQRLSSLKQSIDKRCEVLVQRSKSDVQSSKVKISSDSKSITSDKTITNSVHCKPSGSKVSSLLFTKNYRENARISNFQKRKEYSESLRNRKKPTESAPSELNKSWFFAQTVEVHKVTTKNDSPLKKIPPPRPPPPQIPKPPGTDTEDTEASSTVTLNRNQKKDVKSSLSGPYGNISGGTQSSGVNYGKLTCLVCKKLFCSCVKKQPSNEEPFEPPSKIKKPNQPSSLPTIIRPVPRRPIRTETVQTFLLLPQHSNITNVFTNRYKFPASSSSIFFKDSFNDFSSSYYPKSTKTSNSYQTVIFDAASKYTSSKSSHVVYGSDSDEVFMSEEMKRILAKRSSKGLKPRKRNSVGKPIARISRIRSEYTSKNLFSTIEENRGIQEETAPSSYSICEDTSEFLDRVEKELEIEKENKRPKKRAKRHSSLLETCQSLKNGNARSRCSKSLDSPYSPNLSNDRFKKQTDNDNFFQNTKNLIYEKLGITAGDLANLELPLPENVFTRILEMQDKKNESEQKIVRKKSSRNDPATSQPNLERGSKKDKKKADNEKRLSYFNYNVNVDPPPATYQDELDMTIDDIGKDIKKSRSTLSEEVDESGYDSYNKSKKSTPISDIFKASGSQMDTFGNSSRSVSTSRVSSKFKLDSDTTGVDEVRLSSKLAKPPVAINPEPTTSKGKKTEKKHEKKKNVKSDEEENAKISKSDKKEKSKVPYSHWYEAGSKKSQKTGTDEDSEGGKSVVVTCHGHGVKKLIRTISKQFCSKKSGSTQVDNAPCTQDTASGMCSRSAKNRSSQTGSPQIDAQTSASTSRNKNSRMQEFRCPCSDDMYNLDFYQKKVNECHEYAEKVRRYSKLREEGYLKQLQDFREIPLSVLLGKRPPKKETPQTTAPPPPPIPPPVESKVDTHSIGVQVDLEEESAREPPPTTQPTPPPPPSPPPSSSSSTEIEEQSVPIPPVPIIIEEEVEPPTVEEEEESPTVEEEEEELATVNSTDSSKLEELKETMGDQEIFDKLLGNYEKEEQIADRLSNDQEFFESQLKLVKSKESVESFFENKEEEPKKEKSATAMRRISKLFKKKGSVNEILQPQIEKKTVQQRSSIESDPGKVSPSELGRCFRRGFRPDNIVLTGETVAPVDKAEENLRLQGLRVNATQSIIDFSERETPLEFLLALGFSVDEASNAIKDEDVKNRMLAAIIEARVWINQINTTQGTLLYLLAYKAKPRTMRYFLQLVEAVINKRVNNAIKLDGFLRVLEQLEDGDIKWINVLGRQQFEDEENEEKAVKKQLRHLFANVYKVAEKEAAARGKTLSKNSIVLLKMLAAKYRAGLHPHLELIAKYIGQGALHSDVQLEAAMIYLARLDTADVKLEEFEQYCAIRKTVDEGSSNKE